MNKILLETAVLAVALISAFALLTEILAKVAGSGFGIIITALLGLATWAALTLPVAYYRAATTGK